MVDTNDPQLLRRIEAAQAAVASQRELFDREFGQVASEWKKDGSRVTAADHAISANILARLAAEFPEDQGFSEELLIDHPLEVTSAYSWVLDPIDGTNNFATGLPQCAIVLALLHAGEPIYGVIYDFPRRSIMHGGPGFGAWVGEEPIRISGARLSRRAFIGFHSPHDPEQYPGHAEALVQRCKIRGLGSSALHLAYVAAGILDGTVDHNVKIWDIAAAIPLVRATGGEVRFLANNPLPLRRFDLAMPRIFYVAGSPEMCADLAALFAAA